MSTNIIDTKKDAEGKNKSKIYCTFCPSKMLNAGAARLINMEFALPYIHSKGEDKANQSEVILNYWGPVGWHDLSTQKSYIALCRVKHE
ncbi:unnamed protein product [Lasius platythorax]|uniref:Uncharacterized protein n=1 Tax=Lasius platythorax TaxID=488582 RepID=A0AAV2N172_9HYME